MKNFLKGLCFCSLFAVGARAHACGTISCFDYCSSSYVQVTGDSCDTEFDPQQGCYRAKGVCGTGCTGTIACFDFCQSTYVYFSNSDTCTTIFDPQNGCYKADGYCAN